MYHLSSSSLRNLFTTGDPISALSHEFEGPKSNTNPLDKEECDDDPEYDDDDDEGGNTSSLAASGSDALLETELGSSFGVLCVSLLALVSGFVEQQRMKGGNFLVRVRVRVLGFVEDAHDGIKVVGLVKRWKLESFERELRGFNEGSAIDDVVASMVLWNEQERKGNEVEVGI